MVEVTEETLCVVCGHRKGDHYIYNRNGRPTCRCKVCDPIKGRETGSTFAIQKGSDIDKKDKFADHKFCPMLPFR